MPNKGPVRVFLEEELFVLVAGAIAAGMLLAGLVSPARIPGAVDWQLLLVLFALLVAVELVRDSGLLDRAVIASVRRVHSARTLTFALVLLSGMLASLVTNDVTLFVVIPFTVLAGRYAEFPVRQAVVLEILAANLIGCLTPLGNPQNLFLYHQSGWTAARFIAVMTPFVLWSVAGIIVAVFLTEPSRPIRTGEIAAPPLERRRAIAGILCFALVLLEILHLTSAWPAAIVAAIATPLFLRGRFREMDLSIVPLFFFAFIIVEGLRSWPAYEIFADALGLYAGAIVSSQVISNVPAAILLAPIAEATGGWKTLLYGVSAGGCGTIIASLANLLGWQIYLREHGPDPRFFRLLTILNAIFLLWCGIGGWLLLRR